MKKLLLTTTEAYGKEIKNTIYSHENDKLIINFTDDTFLVLEIVISYSDGVAEIQPITMFDYRDFSIEKLVKEGIVSKKEIDELYIKTAELHKTNRFKQYEDLKEEFEKEGNYESYNK